MRTADAGLCESTLKVVRVALVDRDDGSTRLVGSVWKNETRRLPSFEPDAEFKPLRLFIGHRRLREERLDRLRIMDVVLGRVPGNDTEEKRFGEIDTEDGGVVVRVAMHRLREDLDIVEPGDRYAFEKVLDMSVAALPRVGIRLLIQAEKLIVEGRLMRPRQLLVLHEIFREVPGLRRHFRPAEAGLDEAIGGLEILIQQKAGRHERLPDGVDMLARLLLRKIRRETEGIHPATKEGRQCVLVFTVRKPAHDRARGGALDLAARPRDALPQDADDREPLVVSRMVFRLPGWHFPQRKLIDDILGCDQRLLRGERQLETRKFAVAFLRLGVVAFQAVFSRELGKYFLPGCFRRLSECRDERESKVADQVADHLERGRDAVGAFFPRH